MVLQYPSETVSKNHWFYSIRPKKYQKTVGFTVSVRKSIKKPLVLLYPSEKVSKNHWFYSVRPKKYQKTIGFTDRATKNVEKPLVLQAGQPKTLKNHWFYCKTSPGQPGNRMFPPIRGLQSQYSSWRSYEEPLQPSCLGKHSPIKPF